MARARRTAADTLKELVTAADQHEGVCGARALPHFNPKSGTLTHFNQGLGTRRYLRYSNPVNTFITGLSTQRTSGYRTSYKRILQAVHHKPL